MPLDRGPGGRGLDYDPSRVSDRLEAASEGLYEGLEREDSGLERELLPESGSRRPGSGALRLRPGRPPLPSGSRPPPARASSISTVERVASARARARGGARDGRRPRGSGSAQGRAVPRMRPGSFGRTFLDESSGRPARTARRGPVLRRRERERSWPRSTRSRKTSSSACRQSSAGSRLLPPPMVLLASASFSR